MNNAHVRRRDRFIVHRPWVEVVAAMASGETEFHLLLRADARSPERVAAGAPVSCHPRMVADSRT